MKQKRKMFFMVPDIILVPPCCFPMGGLLSVAKIQQSPQTRCGGHRCQVKERLGGERWPCQGCVSICAVISYEPTGTLGRLFVNKTTTTCQNGFIFSFFSSIVFLSVKESALSSYSTVCPPAPAKPLKPVNNTGFLGMSG